MVKKITGVFTTLDAEGNEVELYPEGTLGSDNSVTLTRAEYDALSDAEKNSDTTYYISDEDAQPNAFSVPFTSDKYTASNTGDALIEVKTELEETNNNLNNISINVSGYESGINISNYTEGNPYILPKSGLVTAASNTSNQSIKAVIGIVEMGAVASATYPIACSLYLPKGTKVYNRAYDGTKWISTPEPYSYLRFYAEK